MFYHVVELVDVCPFLDWRDLATATHTKVTIMIMLVFWLQEHALRKAALCNYIGAE